MQIAELFVSLGIKGAEKTVGALTSVKSGLGNIATTAFAVKASVIGAVYALEQLMSHSAQQGTTLSNFNALMKMSTKDLQQWQYAAQQAGVSGEEFTSSLKSVSEKMTQMKLNKGRPEGLAILANTVGFDVEKAYKDTFYVMKKLQEFSKSNVSTDIQNNVMKSFGVSENIISAMRKGVFNETNFKKAPLYSEKEVEALNKADVAMKNLNQQVGMLFGRFTAKHGEQLIKDISKVAIEFFKLIEAMNGIASKLEVFKIISETFDGWAKALNTVTKSLEYLFPKNEKEKAKAAKSLEDDPLALKAKKGIAELNLLKENTKTTALEIWDGTKKLFNSFSDGIAETAKKDFSSFFSNNENNQKNNGANQNSNPNNNNNPFYLDVLGSIQDFIRQNQTEKRDDLLFLREPSPQLPFSISPILKENPQNQIPFSNNIAPKMPAINQSSIAPKMPAINQSSNVDKTQNIDVNQNLYFQHEGKEAPKIADSINKSIRDAWKQLSAQSQGA